MTASPDPPSTPPAPSRSADRATGDSAFEASAFERSLGRDDPRRWIGWRRRLLIVVAVLGCLSVVLLARQAAQRPHIEADWDTGAQGQLILRSSPHAPLQAMAGSVLVSVGRAGAIDATGASEGENELAVDGLLLHHAPRWQVDDAARARQITQQQGLAALLARGDVRLRFAGGNVVQMQAAPRGLGGLGLLFWPLAALGLLVYLFGWVVVLARPRLPSLLYAVMALCQSVNLVLIALDSAPGLGTATGLLAGDLTLRLALELCTGAAALQAFVLQPRRLPHAALIAALGWALVPAWVGLAQTAGAAAIGAFGPLWWWGQAAGLVLSAATLAAISHSHRLEPNPFALVMRRFALAVLITFVLVTAAVALTARLPAAAADMAMGASITWYLFFASLLLLTPTMSRNRLLLREFALLAGISTVTTSLDLVFVAAFSLGSFASLTLAVFIGLALYAGARQWILNHLLGGDILTTERIFEQLYRAARELQARPRRHAQVLASLLRELFEPLELVQVDRVPLRSRVIGAGAGLVVPMRSADEGTAAAALVLRFAHRGERLFTMDDARLADRVVDQLRRAVAYDQAVERGRAEERQRIAQDLHDDIGARLLTLMYQAQTREMEDYIRHTLQDLKTLTRGLAASEHRLSHAAPEWKSDLSQRLAAAHAALDWSFTYDRDLRLSVVQWSALTRVLRELVSNALYHGHASRIEVSFQLQAEQLMLQVADDGQGRDPRSWAHGLGLGGVRKRVKLLGGEVAWRENEPRGIVCTVRIADFTGRR